MAGFVFRSASCLWASPKIFPSSSSSSLCIIHRRKGRGEKSGGERLIPFPRRKCISTYCCSWEEKRSKGAKRAIPQIIAQFHSLFFLKLLSQLSSPVINGPFSPPQRTRTEDEPTQMSKYPHGKRGKRIGGGEGGRRRNSASEEEVEKQVAV